MQYTFSLLLILLLSSCVKQQFEEPSAFHGDQDIPTYSTIAGLLERMTGTGGEVKEHILISGIVIADDRSGNLYKQIIIDDGTAAVPVLLDGYNLYSRFPVGTRLNIYCRGLFTGTYYKLPQLGYLPDSKGALSPVPFFLWEQYIVKTGYGYPTIPVTAQLSDISKAKPELFNRLVYIPEAQFMDTTASMYAYPSEQSAATNMVLMDCDSNTLLLRTSGYSSFRDAAPPKGAGGITGIYSVFNNTPQLILRDTADVKMSYPRCVK